MAPKTRTIKLQQSDINNDHLQLSLLTSARKNLSLLSILIFHKNYSVEMLLVINIYVTRPEFKRSNLHVIICDDTGNPARVEKS